MDMACRGFMAVGVNCANTSYPRGCQGFNDKAADVFSPKDWTAISALCALRDDADCTSMGIAVSGFSQGANAANLARNYNPRVQRACLTFLRASNAFILILCTCMSTTHNESIDVSFFQGQDAAAV